MNAPETKTHFKFRIFLFLYGITVFLLSFSYSFAQELPPDVELPPGVTAQDLLNPDNTNLTPTPPPLPDEFVILINPPVPEPNGLINARIVATFTISSTTPISWYVNNARVIPATGTAPGTITVRAPAIRGQLLTFKAIITVNGKTLERTMQTVVPAISNQEQLREIEQGKQALEELKRQNEELEKKIYGGRKANQNFYIVLDDKNPKPHQTVNLHVAAALIDLDRSNIEWFVDGKKELEGVGEKNFTLETGRSGTSKTVRARATAENGNVYTDELSISPLAVSLYWWADTAVPYWYKGKALPSRGNQVKIAAFAPVGSPKPQNFIYLWLLNDIPQPTVSGTNKQVFSFRPYVDGLSDEITLRIESADKTMKTEVKADVFNVSPEISFCVVDILSGCAKAADEIFMKPGESLEILANTFFFGKIEAKNLIFSWGEGSEKNKSAKPWRINIKAPDDIRGTLTSELSVRGVASKLTASNILKIRVGPK